MTSLLRQDLLCLLFLSAGSLGLPHLPCPTNRYNTDDIDRGDNYVDDEHAIYTLDLLKARKGYIRHETYSIRVKSNSPDNKFNDVHMSLEARDERCGAGQFILSKSLYQPSGCYNIVSTQRKEPMGKTTFKWKAPLCGCVTIRAVVHSTTGEYFLDDDTEDRGSLVKTVCPQENVSIQAKDNDNNANSNEHDDENTGTHTSLHVEPTYEEKVEFLCRANEKISGAELLVTDYFKNRRNIMLLNFRQAEDLEEALEQKRNDMLVCCRKYRNQRKNCMDNIRRRRVDNLCGTGYPRVPFVAVRNEWMREREQECCWMIGEERYKCFNYTVYLQSMQLDSKERLNKARSSLDDFDPLNDMEDYPANLVMSLAVSQQSHQGHIENRQKTFSGISNKFRGTTSKGIKSKPVSSADSSRANSTNIMPNKSMTSIAWDPTVKESHTLKSANSSSYTSSASNNNSKVSKTEVSTSSLNVQSEDSVTGTIADSITNEQITSGDSTGQAVHVEEPSSGGDKRTPMQESSPEKITEIKNSDISASISNGSNHINHTSSVTDSGSSHVFSPVKLSDQWCCLRGFLSGSRDQVQTLYNCFEKADAFSQLFPHWTRSCDKNFVVCCMAVSELVIDPLGQSDGSNSRYLSGGAILQQESIEIDETTKVEDVWSDHSDVNNRSNSKIIKDGNSKNNHEHRVKSRPDSEKTKQPNTMRKSQASKKQKIHKKTKPDSGKNIQQGSKMEHSHLLDKIVTNNLDSNKTDPLWDRLEVKAKSKEEDEEDGDGNDDDDDDTNDVKA